MTMHTFTVDADTATDDLLYLLDQNFGACHDLVATKNYGEHTVELGRDAGENVNDYAEILFFPALNRAAIDNNGGTLWTDATSVEDAIRRYREDDLQN